MKPLVWRDSHDLRRRKVPALIAATRFILYEHGSLRAMGAGPGLFFLAKNNSLMAADRSRPKSHPAVLEAMQTILRRLENSQTVVRQMT